MRRREHVGAAGEIEGRHLVGRAAGPLFLDRLAEGRVELFGLPSDVPDLRGYVGLALRGGFPEPALRLSTRAELVRYALERGLLETSA